MGSAFSIEFSANTYSNSMLNPGCNILPSWGQLWSKKGIQVLMGVQCGSPSSIVFSNSELISKRDTKFGSAKNIDLSNIKIWSQQESKLGSVQNVSLLHVNLIL